jgi:O-acetyl-ADP-ribose deacetylase (regulator of RNase III)
MAKDDVGLELLKSDITTLAVDAIVNAANEQMLGGGGVDGAIHRAAGPQLLEACRRIPQVRPGVRCPTGEARITPGFRLPARFVIHTVGPVWHGGGQREAELLAACYRNSLALAREHGLRTLAFPAISCGVFGYPPRQAAAIAVREIRTALEAGGNPEKVYLVAFGEEVRVALAGAIESG